MRRTRAFTLIEVLVVVAIIALLASILMPALKEARRVSKRAVCLSNLTHIGEAIRMYLHNNRDTFPDDVARFPTAQLDKRTLTDMLKHEMGGGGSGPNRSYVNKVFLCPADVITKKDLLDKPEIVNSGRRYFDSQKTSYEWNDFLGGRTFHYHPTMMIYENKLGTEDKGDGHQGTVGSSGQVVIPVSVQVRDYLLVSDYEVWHGEKDKPKTFNALYMNFESRFDKETSHTSTPQKAG